MAESSSDSLSDLWNKLQRMFSKPSNFIASSSCPPVLPELTPLNEMVYEVHKPPPEKSPELEIVFFHGLQLKPCKESYITTWMSRDDSQFWPQTWLAKAFPSARILTISYDSTAKRTNQDGWLDMFCTSENLLFSLTSESVKLGEAGCPIVLVGHCLGGLLLKDLCLHTNATLSQKSAGMQRMDHFFKNLRGMFFYGTPHLGSSFGEELPENCKGSLLSDIEIFNASNARRNESFWDLRSRHKWVTYGVGETHNTFLDCFGKGKHMRVVLEASSRPNMDGYYSADANHFDVCKPEVECSGSFLRLKDFLHKIHTEGLHQSQVAIDAVIGREYFVDYGRRVEKVKSMLAQSGGRTVFIVGLSGIGKTSLAKEVTRNISQTFSVTCFVHLDDIDRESNKSDQFLGEQVLKKVQTVLERQDKGWHYNHFCVPQYLKGRKVLVVLDNVQSQCQLDALNMAIWLEGTTSRLIVTTRLRLGLSEGPDQSNTFEVEYLHHTESSQLFCHYAFNGSSTPDCLMDSVDLVMKRCGNFPLSLKVLGSYLRKQDVHNPELWKGVLERLKNAEEVASDHDYRFWSRLRPCYDVLQNTDQETFLDIANVFCGFPLDYVQHIWNKCRDSLAWTNLKQGFLVSENEIGLIEMHGLLRAMGRRIACPPRSTIDKWRRVPDLGSTGKFIASFEGDMETLSLELRVQRNERVSLRNSIFTQFVNVQYLILDGIETTEGSVELPSSLVYVRWKGGLFEACPLDFTHSENLVVLDLQFCEAMKILPSSVGRAEKLEWLELKGCGSLTDFPLEVLKLIELKHLGLSMTGITKLPKKLGKLKNLTDLQANSTQLTRIRPTISRVDTLQVLNISNTAVKFLPESIGNLKFLRSLKAKDTFLSSLPESIGQIRMLEYLNIRRTAVTVLPKSIGRLKQLVRLDLRHTRIKGLPRSLGDLVGLQSLDLDSTPLETLPDSICNLRSLSFLNLRYTRIQGLPQSIGDLAGLERLWLKSTPLEIVPDSICNLRSLWDLDLSYTQITTLPDALGELTKLYYLHLQGSRLRSLPLTAPNLRGLHVMDLTIILNGCDQLGSATPSTILGGHEDVSCSVNLSVGMLGRENTGVQEEEQIPGTIVSLSALMSIPRFCSIYQVDIDGRSYKQCVFPALFHALQQLPHLTTLRISDFNEVEIMPPELGTLATLLGLDIEECNQLRELPESLGDLLHLRNLELRGLPKLQGLPESYSNIWVRGDLRLIVVHCESLQSMPSSCGHTSPMSKSLDDQCTTSNSTPTLYPALNQAEITTDSRRVLRCLLECCNLGRCAITFVVECDEFERLSSVAIGGTTVDPNIFMAFLMEYHSGSDDPDEIFWFPSIPEFDLSVICYERYWSEREEDEEERSEVCGNDHKWRKLGVMDIDEEDNGNTEEDSERDEDEDEEDDEEDNGNTEDSEKDEGEEDDEEENGDTEDSEKDEVEEDYVNIDKGSGRKRCRCGGQGSGRKRCHRNECQSMERS